MARAGPCSSLRACVTRSLLCRPYRLTNSGSLSKIACSYRAAWPVPAVVTHSLHPMLAKGSRVPLVSVATVEPKQEKYQEALPLNAGLECPEGRKQHFKTDAAFIMANCLA